MSHGEGPLVTAVVTTFDRPSMAKRAVQSVLAQTYELVEVVVVEDGSRNGIDRWLEEMKLQRVRYFRHERNRGLAATRNTGIKNARGDYIAFLDDDDEWLPEKLARQVNQLRREGDSCGVVYCGALLLSEEGEVVGQNRPKLCGDIRSAIREKGLFTVPSSCVFRRAALDRVGGYDETLPSHIDHDIWLQLAREGYACSFVDECLVKVHQHHEQKMTDDASSRVEATRLFCTKWEDYLETWFGRWETRRYCSQFKGRVMAMLGWALFDKGKRRQGLKYFLMALRYDWKRRDYYEGLVASIIGTGLWERFLKTWKRFDRCTT
jgi:glycosyltransferase involved in cell wall biosynthesis